MPRVATPPPLVLCKGRLERVWSLPSTLEHKKADHDYLRNRCIHTTAIQGGIHTRIHTSIEHTYPYDRHKEGGCKRASQGLRRGDVLTHFQGLLLKKGRARGGGGMTHIIQYHTNTQVLPVLKLHSSARSYVTYEPTRTYATLRHLDS